MDAKEQAREIWDKVHAWGTAKIGELSFMEQLAIATEPEKKDALLIEERAYAEAIIASALAEKDAEIARLRVENALLNDIAECDAASFDDLLDLHSEDSECRNIILGAIAMNHRVTLLPPAAQEVKPTCATCAWNTQGGEPAECECVEDCLDGAKWAERIDIGHRKQTRRATREKGQLQLEG